MEFQTIDRKMMIVDVDDESANPKDDFNHNEIDTNDMSGNFPC